MSDQKVSWVSLERKYDCVHSSSPCRDDAVDTKDVLAGVMCLVSVVAVGIQLTEEQKSADSATNSMINGDLETCIKLAIGVHWASGFQDNVIEESLYVHGGTEDDGDSITKCISDDRRTADVVADLGYKAFNHKGDCLIGHEVNTNPKCCISSGLSPPDSSPSVPSGFGLCTFSHYEHGPLLGGEFTPILPSKD